MNRCEPSLSRQFKRVPFIRMMISQVSITLDVEKRLERSEGRMKNILARQESSACCRDLFETDCITVERHKRWRPFDDRLCFYLSSSVPVVFSGNTLWVWIKLVTIYFRFPAFDSFSQLSPWNSRMCLSSWHIRWTTSQVVFSLSPLSARLAR